MVDQVKSAVSVLLLTIYSKSDRDDIATATCIRIDQNPEEEVVAISVPRKSWIFGLLLILDHSREAKGSDFRNF